MQDFTFVLKFTISFWFFQVLKTIPWDKVDIKIISLEVTVGKLDESAEGKHENYYPQIQEFLKSKDYSEVRADWHTPDHITVETYFVKNELAESIDEKYWKNLDDHKLIKYD